MNIESTSRKSNWFLERRKYYYALFNRETLESGLKNNPNFFLKIPISEIDEVISLLPGSNKALVQNLLREKGYREVKGFLERKE